MKKISTQSIMTIVYLLHGKQQGPPYYTKDAIQNINGQVSFVSPFRYQAINPECPLKVQPFLAPDISGQKDFCIYVPDWEPEEKMNMSMAYLLGYVLLYCLEGDQITIPFNPLTTINAIGQEVNYFVGEFLMPRSEFKDACYSNSDKNNGKIYFSELAQTFKVSVDAIVLRGKVLNLW